MRRQVKMFKENIDPFTVEFQKGYCVSFAQKYANLILELKNLRGFRNSIK